jgi:metal-sulfur cluster biosynthetic enzyme
MFLIKLRLRKRLTGISRDINRRKEVEVKNVSQAMVCMMRMTCRERAKDVLFEFLERNNMRLYMQAQVKRTYHRIVWI